MGTAERRLEIMKRLCRRRYETMENLSQEFGVCLRTIQRDIYELTFIMPIYVKSGRYGGGIYVDEKYSMDRMYMSSNEIELLKKVKKMIQGKLSNDENSLLSHIINSYSKI